MPPPRCLRVDGEALDEPEDDAQDTMESLATYLKVLGNAKRLRILKFLQKPHYLEEIASELKMARQSAQEHVQQLLEIGVIQRVRNDRQPGAVVNYVVVPHRLFSIQNDFGELSLLEPEVDEDEDLRPRTSPLLTGQVAPKEQDLPRVTIVRGMRVGQTITLVGNGPWLVGRELDAAVSLDYDPFVSGRHAEIRRAPGGGFEAADLYSSNGTWVDWKRLPRGSVAKLENGFTLRAGKTILLFRKPA